MATRAGQSGKLSKSIGSQVEGDHESIGTGGGAPANGGDGKQSLKSPDMGGTPVKEVRSGDVSPETAGVNS